MIEKDKNTISFIRRGKEVHVDAEKWKNRRKGTGNRSVRAVRIERDTVNKTIVFKKSMFEKIEKMAEETGISFNMIVNDIVVNEMKTGREVQFYEFPRDEERVARTITFKKTTREQVESLAESLDVSFNKLVKNILYRHLYL